MPIATFLFVICGLLAVFGIWMLGPALRQGWRPRFRKRSRPGMIRAETVRSDDGSGSRARHVTPVATSVEQHIRSVSALGAAIAVARTRDDTT
jgi:hypothetical protein